MSDDANPRQNVTFDSDGTPAHGYLATPASGTGPGLVVIQEWWGLDESLAEVVDRFAAEGFVALAPDLYGGEVAHSTDDAQQMMNDLPAEKGAELLGGAVDHLLGLDSVTSSTVGTVGFCMGGGFVLSLAAQQGDKVSAAVPFYGVGQGVPDSYRGITGDVQGHYGEQDDFYPVDQARQQEQQITEESSGSVEFFYYPAGHAFMNPEDKMGTHDQASADLAWSRTVGFLRERVR